MVLAWLLACAGRDEERPAGGPTGPEMTQAAPAGAVVAKVGAHGMVTVDEFTQTASRQVLMHEAEVTPEARKEILDEMIDEEVLFQEAFAQGLYRDPKVRALMINLLKRREVVAEARGLEISDEEAEAYFEAHIDDFRMPEKALVKRIFIGFGGQGDPASPGRTEEEAKKLAADLRSQIVADPDKFRKLAEEYSEDSYQRRGGTMGYVDNVPDSPFPREFLDKVFALEEGRVSEPFLAGGGYNIAVVEAHRDAVERTFEQMKGTVLRRMRSERQGDLTEKYVASLRAKAEVTIDEALLASAPVDRRLARIPDPEEVQLELEARGGRPPGPKLRPSGPDVERGADNEPGGGGEP